jgi:hypothetical protein
MGAALAGGDASPSYSDDEEHLHRDEVSQAE